MERKNYISRKAIKQRGAGQRGERLEQIIASNIDNLFVIASIERPQFNNRFLDRLLVIGESSHINTVIVINKIDIDSEELAELWKELYEEVGYEVLLTSVKENIGIENLHQKIIGNKNIFWGQSGVGKSSLLNKLFPDLDLKTSDVSDYSNKGKHTTVTSNMISLGNNTFVIDTPGIREIDPYGISKENLGHYFKDFTPFINNCKFNTCTHNHEPGCAIIANVENENITVERYESYLNMLETIEEGINF